MTAMCIFYRCQNPADGSGRKCIVHLNRTPCKAFQCPNQAYARGRCVRHGARKLCREQGCPHHRRAGGYCARHTAAMGLQKKPDRPLLQLEPLAFGSVPPSVVDTDWLEVLDLFQEDRSGANGSMNALSEPPLVMGDWEFLAMCEDPLLDLLTSTSCVS
ncbi:hypothetical protein AC1031_004335 [Aphanomyces cochlioides]|nr:hypothetical protein AC1031_004335 [Aphanomyces cochlioides]